MTASLVAHAGRLLYGADWVRPLARALQLNTRTAERIAAAADGGKPCTVAPGVLVDLAGLLAVRSADCAALAETLKRAASGED